MRNKCGINAEQKDLDLPCDVFLYYCVDSNQIVWITWWRLMGILRALEGAAQLQASLESVSWFVLLRLFGTISEKLVSRPNSPNRSGGPCGTNAEQMRNQISRNGCRRPAAPPCPPSLESTCEDSFVPSGRNICKRIKTLAMRSYAEQMWNKCGTAYFIGWTW